MQLGLRISTVGIPVDKQSVELVRHGKILIALKGFVGLSSQFLDLRKNIVVLVFHNYSPKFLPPMI